MENETKKNEVHGTSSFLESNSYLASQEIPHLSWNPKGFTSPMHATCPIHFIMFDLITQIIRGGENKL
jgi:hypothetical protein